MSAHYEDGPVTVWHGDCLDVMRTLPDASVDAVVTDPPYGISFMGKDWDSPAGQMDGPLARGGTHSRGYADNDNRAFQAWCELWAIECFRLLKPGGHLLAFGGTRTFHRLTAGIEDAGFEIRDSLAWLYGQGFAKSWNFSSQYNGPWCECRANPVPSSHASDAHLHRLRENVPTSPITRGTSEGTDLLESLQRSEPRAGLGDPRAQGSRRVDDRPGTLARNDAGQLEPVLAGRDLHRTEEGLPDDPEAGPSAGPSERVRRGTPPRHGSHDRPARDATRGGASHKPRPGGQPAGKPEAVPGSHGALDDGALRGGAVCPRCGGLDQAYKGAGSALKPAFEPIVVARKPLSGTLAQTVLAYGTGALNIDANRIGTAGGAGGAGDFLSAVGDVATVSAYGDGLNGAKQRDDTARGRWPANVVLDASQAAALDTQSGERSSGLMFAGQARQGKPSGILGEFKPDEVRNTTYGDTGGASRFFKTVDDVAPRFMYTAKAGSDERPNVDGIAHPTVKSLDLMRWLVRLVTPPGGTVLEPFAGSGTTVEAAVLEGFRCVAIEREADYLPLILQRIRKPHAVGLDFGDWDWEAGA